MQPRVRGTVALSILVLFAVLLAPVGAEGAASAAGTLRITIKAPVGATATVRLTKDGFRAVATKPATVSTRTISLRLRSGRWVLSPQDTVKLFRTYSSPRRVVTVGAGATTNITVTYRVAPTVTNMRVTGLSTNSVSLAWTPPANTQTRVRMAAGVRPPAAVTSGVGVAVSQNRTASAKSLAAGKRYAFAVFTRKIGTTRWYRATLTAQTRSADPDAPVSVSSPTTVMVASLADVTPIPVTAGVAAKVPAGVTPALGQSWVLPRTTTFPGMIGKVASIAADGGSVVLQPAGVADAFDYVSGRVDDLSSLVPAGALGARTARSLAASLSCSGGETGTIVVDPSFDPFGHFDVELDRWGAFAVKGVSFDVEFGFDVGLTVSVATASNATCEVSLPSLEANFTLGAVPFRLEITPTVGANFGGGLEVSNLGFNARLGNRISGYLGLGAPDNIDGEAIEEISTLDPEVTGTAASLTLTAGVEGVVGPGSGKKGPAGAGGMVGLAVTYNPVEARGAVSVNEEAAACLELSSDRVIQAALQAQAWFGTFSVKRTITVPGLQGRVPWGESPWTFGDGCSVDPGTSTASPYELIEDQHGFDWSFAAQRTGSPFDDFTFSGSASGSVIGTPRVAEVGDYQPRCFADADYCEMLPMNAAPTVQSSAEAVDDSPLQYAEGCFSSSRVYSSGTPQVAIPPLGRAYEVRRGPGNELEVTQPSSVSAGLDSWESADRIPSLTHLDGFLEQQATKEIFDNCNPTEPYQINRPVIVPNDIGGWLGEVTGDIPLVERKRTSHAAVLQQVTCGSTLCEWTFLVTENYDLRAFLNGQEFGTGSLSTNATITVRGPAA